MDFARGNEQQPEQVAGRQGEMDHVAGLHSAGAQLCLPALDVHHRLNLMPTKLRDPGTITSPAAYHQAYNRKQAA
ncbi:hypothetical protein FALBO_15392 [Fusarium albosuccineum]|uniref:Uncharacterized protein n=1 Tax=Fusarium albosuccineum TaxID=1237068 RepID=A0A8H4KWB1_9HYPO|nr:hypothetical protein FALBO_15392 [Fusarium albosuccineum]